MMKPVPAHELLATGRWCWNYLLIDGMALPNAERQLYQADEFPHYLNLYAGTHWEAIADLGPLLIAVTDQNPFIQRFLEEGFAAEWGYLIQSPEDLPTLAAQFRQCITVRHASGSDLVLRFGEPGVATAMFTELDAFRRWRPALEALLVPDALNWQWQHIAIASIAETVPALPVTLSEQDVARLSQVDERSLLKRLVAHLDRFFLGWDSGSGRAAGVVNLGGLISRAKTAGYTSERSLTQWANVFGYGGAPASAAELPPALLSLLDAPPELSRIDLHARDAAILARAISAVPD